VEAVPVFDGALEEGFLTVLGAAVGDLVGEVMCVPSRCGVERDKLGIVESNLVVDDFVKHDKSGLLLSFLEGLPLQICKHVGDAGPVVVLVFNIPCSSSLDHVKAVYVSFLMGVPDSTCILHCGADLSFVCCFFGGSGGDIEVSL